MNKELSIINISGVDCYEKDGVAYLRLETVARGLGFTEKAASGNECVKWSRVRKYLADIGAIDTSVDGYIPENIFYRLAMKAKSATAEAFQAKIADEVIPMIRKTGGYVNNDELFVNTYMPYADDGTKAMFLLHLKAQRETNEKLKEMSPKAEYFDRLIDRGSALSIRDTAKSLGIKETALKELLFDHGYIYRDQKNRIRPYAEKNKGYFVLKEFNNENSGYASVQTLITVEGREKLLSLLNTEKGGIVQ